MNNHLIRITDKRIDIDDVYKTLQRPENGAILLFLGSVRSENDGHSVEAVSYDGFAPLAEKVFWELADEVCRETDDPLQIALVHRLGQLSVGEISTVVGVSSPHRDLCYMVSRHLIEQIKVRLPVWKKEHYIDGTSDWLDGVELTPPACRNDPSRWTIP